MTKRKTKSMRDPLVGKYFMRPGAFHPFTAGKIVSRLGEGVYFAHVNRFWRRYWFAVVPATEMSGWKFYPTKKAVLTAKAEDD